jgi:hypothetical protein
MCKCNFIYAHNKSNAFPMLTVTKIRNVQQYHMQISYTEFHPNPTWKVQVGIYVL